MVILENIGERGGFIMAKIKSIGIIAENDSDFDALKVIIERLVNKTNLTFKKATTNGCAKLRRKCREHAETLRLKGCNLLLVVHDLDRNNLATLKQDLETKLHPSPIANYFICIPIEELEGWFLSDPECLKSVFKLPKAPKISGNPETIPSPKEHLEGLVKKDSNRKKYYLNTNHNSIIAKAINIGLIESKCPSFLYLSQFLLSHKY
jgi:hypothetical protein